MTLSFTLTGKLCSNNRTTRHFGRRSVKSAEAIRDQSRVFQLAFAEAQKIGWTQQPAVAVIIVAVNSRLDAGNVDKNVSDGLIGVAYADDSAIVDLRVIKRKDHDGERYEVTVAPREVLVKPPKPRKAQA